MKYVESPLNYIGSKYKLLNQILPLLPKNINTFVDLFAGGCNVGINVSANKIIFNDNTPHLVSIYEMLKNQPISTTLQQINRVIMHHKLSKNNKETFLKYRDYINNKDKEPIDILVAIFYSFNNQIRWNSKGDYMTTSGKNRSSFNSSLRTKMINFVSKLQKINCEFSDKDFRDFDFSILDEKDFVYADPPYFLGDVDYSRQSGWNAEVEKELYDKFLHLHNKGIKFAISNVLEHKGKFNKFLDEWVNENNFNMIFLNKQYDNACYCAVKKSNSQEVLVTNYLVKRNRLF